MKSRFQQATLATYIASIIPMYVGFSVIHSEFLIIFGLDYPTNITGLGYLVKAEQDYAGIKLFSHPAPIILFSTFITFVIYKSRSIWTKILD